MPALRARCLCEGMWLLSLCRDGCLTDVLRKDAGPPPHYRAVSINGDAAELRAAAVCCYGAAS